MFGTKLNTDYIIGMAKIGGGIKNLLDIDKVLSTKGIWALEKMPNFLIGGRQCLRV